MSEFTLRGYQQQARDAVLSDWDSGTKSVLVQMCVASGKTDMGLGVIAEIALHGKPRILWLAHRKELIDQPGDRITDHWPALKSLVGRVRGRHDEWDSQLVVATIQTLDREHRLHRVLNAGKFTHMVIDEAHHAAASTYMELVKELRELNPDLRLLGLTATPRGGSGKKGLGEVFDKVSYRFSTLDGIKAGVLAPFRVLGVNLLSSSFADVPIHHGDYDDEASGKVLAASNAYECVVETWLKHGENRPTLAYVPDVYSVGVLRGLFQKAGVPVASVIGETPEQIREQRLKDFKNGTVKVLVNCLVFTEGTDMPWASCLLQCRPTTSDSTYLQIAGRVLRTDIGKTDAVLIDFAPADARDLVQASDVLEVPEQAAAAIGSGTVADEESLTIHATRVEADPNLLRLKVLNYFTKSDVVWRKTPGWATATLNGEVSLAVRETLDGRFEVFTVHSYSGAQRVSTCKDWNRVVTVADGLAAKHKSNVLGTKGADWRSGPMTEKQAQYCKDYGLDVPPGCTRGLASQIIADDKIKFSVRQMERQSEIRFLKRIVGRAQRREEVPYADYNFFLSVLDSAKNSQLTDEVRAAYTAKAKELGLLKGR